MAIKQDIHSAVRSTVAVFISFLLTVLGLGLLLWVLSESVRPPVLGPAFFDQFSAEGRFFTSFPFYRIGFQAACLASPILVLLTLPVGMALADRLPEAWLAAGGERRLAGFLALFICLGCAACLSRVIHFPHPPALYNSPRWLVHSVIKHLSWRQWLVVAGIDLGLLWFFVRNRKPSAGSRRITGLLLLAAWLFSSPVKFFSAADVDDTVPYMIHFNAVAHSAVEVANGRHRLVDFTNQYGGYVEFLGPLLRLLPRQVESISLVFCLLHAATFFFLLLLARLWIADDRWCLIVGLGLLFCGNLYLFLFGGGDFIFQTYALRAFFPSLTLCAAFLYFRKPSGWKFAGVSVVAALATIWNLESGIFLWAAWTAALGYAAICRRRWVELGTQLALQAAVAATVWALFWVYLFFVGGHWPDGHRLAAYQKLFYAIGVGNLPMVVPDLWVLPIAVYLLEMVRCGLGFYRGEADGRKAFSVMLVVFGMGLFSYFQNRAASSNLLFVSYPAVLIFAGMVDERLARSSGAARSRWEWGWYAPGLAILLWWAGNFTLSLPLVAQGLQREARVLLHSQPTSFQIDAAFIRSQTVPGEPCFLLSRQSGLQHFLSGTPGLLPLASPEEWETSDEFGEIFSALENHQLPKVFLDQDFFKFPWVRPELLEQLRETLDRCYQPVATSATGQVTLYLPRTSSDP